VRRCRAAGLLGLLVGVLLLSGCESEAARAESRKAESDLIRAERAAWQAAHPSHEREHAPMVSVTTPTGSFTGWLGQATIARRLEPGRRYPVVISVAACPASHSKEGFPRNAFKDMPVMAFSPGPHDPDNRWTELRLCEEGDGEELRQSLETGLEVVMEAALREPWVDPARIILVGKGDGAPVVASWPGPVQAKFLVGEPCVAPWGDIIQHPGTRMEVFLGAGEGQGRATAGRPCPALPRPRFPAGATLHIEPDMHNGAVVSLLRTTQFRAYTAVLEELATPRS
jgi:hypothetical protein